MFAGEATAAVTRGIALVVLATNALVFAVVVASVDAGTQGALHGLVGAVEFVITRLALALGIVVVAGVENASGVRVAVQTDAGVDTLAGVRLENSSFHS